MNAKPESIFRFLLHQKLECGEAAQFDGASHAQRCVDQAIAQSCRQSRRGRDLDQLLPIALQAALALPQVGDCSGAVADDLHFDVAGLGEELFDVDIAVAERLHRLGAAALIGGFQFRDAAHLAHAAAAAARNGLDHDGAVRAERLKEAAGFFDRRRRRRSPAGPARRTSTRGCAPLPLSPKASSTSGVGPTKFRPASMQRRAKSAFSLKKP